MFVTVNQTLVLAAHGSQNKMNLNITGTCRYLLALKVLQIFVRY